MKTYVTERELECWRHIAFGKLTKEIAEAMGVSVKTVEKLRLNLGRKIGARSVADVTRAAVMCGVIALSIRPITVEVGRFGGGKKRYHVPVWKVAS